MNRFTEMRGLIKIPRLPFFGGKGDATGISESLKHTNWEKPKGVIISLGLPVALVYFWYFASKTGLLHRSILPSPAMFMDSLKYLLESGTLAGHLSISIIRVLKGFAVGAGIGIITGILMGIFPRVNQTVALLFGVLMPIPQIGWIPLLILWCGIGETTKIVVIALGTFWSVLLNTHGGIRNVDQKLIEVANVLEKNKLFIITRIILPASMPAIITGIRLGFGNAWRSVVAAEMLAASKGIGFLIAYSRELSQPDIMIVGLLSIGFIGVLIDRAMLLFQKRALRWNTGAS
ncbi:MAG: ABC transporter permease [Treponema sp.]|jgi:sulfonate transport system permease protein|nr:ABC transporter permease [Treponema sp.]